MLELRPRKPAGITEAKLIIHAIETPKEISDGQVARKVLIRPLLLRQTNDHIEKDAEEAFFVRSLAAEDHKDDAEEQMTYVREKLFAFVDNKFSNNKFSQCLAIQITFTPFTFMQDDYQSYLGAQTRATKNKRQ